MTSNETEIIDLPEQLAVGRAKRSTAGNRMRALLEKEIEKDELFEEVENDVDFQEAKDEHDIVDSDFDQDSPDEGAYEDEDDVEERAIEAQEKAEKKASRAKTGPAALKKAPFMRPTTARPPPPATKSESKDSLLKETSTTERPTRTNKRISFASDGITSSNTKHNNSSSKVRTSSRKSTMKSKAETQSKLKLEEERKASLPIRIQPKKKKPRLTQDALIAEALEMEEINRENLKWFLEQEEEKKKNLRNFNKNSIKGPFIRWQSVGLDKFGNKLGEINDDDNFDEYGNLIEQQPPIVVISNESAIAGPSQALPETTTTTMTTSIPTATTISNKIATLDPVFAARAETSAQKSAASLLEAQQSTNSKISADLRIDATSRSYVSIHDLPFDSNWVNEFQALLGDHCSWDSIPMVPTRNRPIRPKKSICPITGLPANYKDPRNGIPFANLEAYRTLTDLMDNRYIWTGSNSNNSIGGDADGNGNGQESNDNVENPLHFGAYVSKEDDVGAGFILKKARLQINQNDLNSQNSWREIYSISSKTSTSTSSLPPHLQVQTSSGTSAPTTALNPNYTYRIGPAPGDESVLLKAAMDLPEGSSRSGAKFSKRD